MFFFPFSDGWVKRRYRPDVQQFAGRDGSSNPGKDSFLTFKLVKDRFIEFDFNMTRELSLKKKNWRMTILYLPDITVRVIENETKLFSWLYSRGSVNWLHWHTFCYRSSCAYHVQIFSQWQIFPNQTHTTTTTKQLFLLLLLYKD